MTLPQHILVKTMKSSTTFLSLALALFVATMQNTCCSYKTCPPCGNIEVPYPLSTSPNCGRSSYRLVCVNNTISFVSIGGTSYRVISINPISYQLIIEAPTIDTLSCSTKDLLEGGLMLNETGPFNISNRNTVMLFNCSQDILFSPLNCSSNSLCRKFEGTNAGFGCRNTLCCTYLKDSAMTSHRIRIRVGGCSAYTSVVNLNPADPPSLWSYGVELQWMPLLPKA